MNISVISVNPYLEFTPKNLTSRFTFYKPHQEAETLINPQSGASLSGTVDLEWIASDTDGDDLSYKVEYSPEGNRWIILEPATSSTRFTVDFSRLPGGDQAAIRVTATDGINSTSALCVGLQSPIKAPEVYIQAPTAGISLNQEEGVFLEGRAYDPQAGWIYDSDGLVWSFDRDGELGRGSLVFADNLSSGSHIITLEASGPSGQRNTKSVTILKNESAQYNVTVSSSPAVGGTVSGGGIYDEGTSVTVTATANAGYTFTNWTEDGIEVSTDCEYTFIIGKNRNLTANFYTISLGDINKDGTVNIQDLTLLAINYGKISLDEGFNLEYDLNQDGIIDLYDLVIISKNLVN